MPATVTFVRHADVAAVLADERFQVPPMPPAGADIDMMWLRATVSRFSEGPAHRRRRGLCQIELDRISPSALRAEAARISRFVPAEEVAVEVLAASLGLQTPVYEPVFRAAAGYLPGMDGGPLGDDAVKQLVAMFGGAADESTAARIALLLQACNATATLIVHAMAAWQKWQPQADAAAIVAETLRYDPPVPVMRRLCVAPAMVGGVRVVPDSAVNLDIATANRDPNVFAEPDAFRPSRPETHLTFGAGLRPCPGRDHAIAIATGAVETLIEMNRGEQP
jgi:cytochrome P450